MKKLRFLVLVATLLSTGSCMKKVENPEFLGVEDFKVHSLGKSVSQLNMRLRFFNPNGFPMELRKADVDVSIEGKPLGKTLLDTVIQIPAKDSFLVPVKMALEMKTVLPNLWSLAAKEDVLLGMVGTVRVKRSGISVTIPVNYSGRQKIRF